MSENPLTNINHVDKTPSKKRQKTDAVVPKNDGKNLDTTPYASRDRDGAEPAAPEEE